MALDFVPSSSRWVNLGAGYSGVRNVPGCTIMAWVNVRSVRPVWRSRAA